MPETEAPEAPEAPAEAPEALEPPEAPAEAPEALEPPPSLAVAGSHVAFWASWLGTVAPRVGWPGRPAPAEPKPLKRPKRRPKGR